jgi:Rne/Rng family ribonuclease
MAKEICISSTPHETRLAILEDDQLAEIYYERENEYTLAGSIYNGRVTRVLPGMQSAFVDLGLERDAFLYVTDFLELEDPEESDELEKAAASGGNQPLREIRHANGQGGARPEQRSEPRQETRQEPRQPRPEPDRSARERRSTVEAGTEFPQTEMPAPELPAPAGQAEDSDSSSAEPGAKRWRGRRRRRGGRGSAGPVADPVETEASAETYLDPASESEPDVAPEIQASAGTVADRSPTQPRPAPPAARTPRPERPERSERSDRSERGDRAPTPFVLPGESLSKYGGEPAGDAPRSAQPGAPPRPASTYKPSTLIESPLEWDGSGLLPGESISRHRGRQPEAPTGVNGEPQGVFSDAAAPEAQEVFEEEFFVEETVEFTPETVPEPAEEQLSGSAIETTDLAPEEYHIESEDLMTEEVVGEEQPEEQLPGAPAEAAAAESLLAAPQAIAFDPFVSDPFFTEPGATDAGPSLGEQHPSGSNELAGAPVIEEASGDEPVAEPAAHHDAVVSEASDLRQSGTGEPETDRDASHHVDPLPPSGFRLFGFGGKKKSEEPPPPPVYPTPVPPPSTVATVSAYAPGSGVVEEELIEEEEFEAPRHHKVDEHDLDEYEEEEKLHTQIRSGELGEMLQEAHLDHRIQLNFDDKASEVDGDEVFDIEEEEEEPTDAEGQAAGNGAATDTAQQRRERGGRGRRGGRGPQSGPGNRRGGPSRRSAQTSDLPIISDLLKPGQEILVQIAKEPIAKKGARITSHIALPGRFLVFMPTVTHVGVSRKISSDDERQRLKRILTSERGDAPGGFIVRTAAEGASEEELRSDLRFLIHLWDEIKQRSEGSKSPALIYHDLSLIERILRDQVSANFSSIWVDSEADYERIVRFLNRFSPTLVRRVKLYTKETPLFEHFGIQDEISKALRSKVWLKSGGSIVINQTEALVAIDINTGKFVGKTARLEDTIVKTNLDAIPEIVRQIRLRDLGGIIIIDFIDMDERKNRFKVMAALEEALKNDRAPTKVLQFNDFGLVAITRKRVKQSLERTLSVPCPTCQATGMVKSPTTVCNEIYTELRKMRKHFENADVLLRVNPETVKALKANNARWLTEFEELINKNILVKSDATLHPEQFDIQG